MTDIDDILNEREKTHGDFSDVAEVAQNIKECFVRSDTSLMQDEAIDMIANKIARICCGNPNEPDHWRDIAGYAMLVVRDLEKRKEVKEQSEKESEYLRNFTNQENQAYANLIIRLMKKEMNS